MACRARVFDIQGFCLHDGPGCRTTFFLSGCPLQCAWCANPESWSTGFSLHFSAEKCRGPQGCTACRDACPRGAISFDQEGRLSLDRNICASCSAFGCADACFHEALRKGGRMMDLGAFWQVVQRDRQYWGDSGGVTFSGGEPLQQPAFLLQALELCSANGVHTAMETSAFCEPTLFLEVLNRLDFCFVDLKHMDPDKHRQGTGVSNQRILDNLALLSREGANARVVLRFPFIPGYNDDPTNLEKMARFLQHNAFFELNILPYHALGASKWKNLGMEYVFSSVPAPTHAQMEPVQEFFIERGIACYLAHQTPF
ncbi:MAG TPA: glycyl-radical enzyme activating protein [Thermotogota bacterium]|nr:glycyl-radical enzyme activating protein [Thermotogota bacterium]